MRKLGFAFFVIITFSTVSAAAANLEAWEEIVTFLSRSLNELKDTAAELRVMGGAAKEEALAQARSRLVALNAPFAAARQQETELQQEAWVEKWRERADRAGDLVEAYKKEQELRKLEIEFRELKDEMCGPRDLYRFDGSCTSPAPFRPYGEPVPDRQN